jgi:hypothetical protein
MNNKQLSLSELIEKLKCKDLNSFLEKLCNTFGNYKLDKVTRIFDLYYHRPKPLRQLCASCKPLLTRSQLAAYDQTVFRKYYPFL